MWILPNQETVDGSGISWAVCKSAVYCHFINKTKLSKKSQISHMFFQVHVFMEDS